MEIIRLHMLTIINVWEIWFSTQVGILSAVFKSFPLNKCLSKWFLLFLNSRVIFPQIRSQCDTLYLKETIVVLKPHFIKKNILIPLYPTAGQNHPQILRQFYILNHYKSYLNTILFHKDKIQLVLLVSSPAFYEMFYSNINSIVE